MPHLQGNITVKGRKVPKKKLRAAFMEVFDKSVLPAINGFIFKEAENYVSEIKGVIYGQQYDWAALSDKYAAWKEAQARTPHSKIKPPQPRTLIATEKYVKSIGAWRGRYNQVYIGFNVNDPKEHERLCLLAKWLEFGTRKMPPRPHWSLVLSTMKRRQGTTKKELGKILHNHLTKLRKVL